jgi:hypothetical protein
VVSPGDTVQAVAIRRSAPDAEPPFLMLVYRTSLSLGDTIALRDEATALRPRFLPMVKRAGVWKAVLQGNGEAVHIGGFFYQRRMEDYVLMSRRTAAISSGSPPVASSISA